MIRPTCQLSGCKNLAKKGNLRVSGESTYKKLCNTHHGKKYYPDTAEGYKFLRRKLKKSVCEECGFIPLHDCQLDIDHIDGNHKNNNKENLKTLCANCHRLKTYNNKDWLKS